MVALEVLGAVVLAGLLLVVTWMAIVGLFGAFGGLRLHRCPECGHLGTAWAARNQPCPYCRHPLMAHLLPVHLRHYLPGDF